MSKGRLEAFCDGVFAIVITLLVLDLRPGPPGSSGYAMFVLAWPKVLVYALSFIIVGVYWVSHHNMLHFVAATDRLFLWLNLLLLLVVAFIPYPASLMSATHADTGSIRIYAGTLCVTNFVGLLMWLYATTSRRLVSPGFPLGFARFVVCIHSAPIVVYGIAIAFAGWQRSVSLALLVFVPLFFILPNPFLDRQIRAATWAIREHEGQVD